MTDATSAVPLRIRFPYESEEDFIDRYGTNVARGGVFVATRSLKSEGTVLQFEFVLRGGDRLMRGEGVVVKTHVDHGGSRSGMTVRFTRLDPPSKALVERVVARRGRRDVAAVAPAREPGHAGEHIPRTFSLPEIPVVTVEGAAVGSEEPTTADTHETEAAQPRTLTVPPSTHSRVSFALDPVPQREVNEPTAAAAAQSEHDGAAAGVEGARHSSTGTWREDRAAGVAQGPGSERDARVADDAAPADDDVDAQRRTFDEGFVSGAPPEVRVDAVAGDASQQVAEDAGDAVGRRERRAARDPVDARDTFEPRDAADASDALDSHDPLEARDPVAAHEVVDARDGAGAPDTIDARATIEEEAQTAADEAYASWIRTTADAQSAPGDTPEQPVASGASADPAEAESRTPHRDTPASAMRPDAPARTDEAPVLAGHDGSSTAAGPRTPPETPPALDTDAQAEATALANAEPVLGIDASGTTPTAALIADGKIHPVATPAAVAGYSTEASFSAVHAAAQMRSGRRFEHTAICVPARYTDLDRAEVLRAADAAGLPRCQLFNASTAVALAFAHGRGLPRKRVLVCDVGANDAEIALVAITGDDVEVVVTAGIAALPDPAPSPDAPDPVVALCTSLLEDAHLTARSLDEVLLVGPGAKAPHLREKLEAALQRRPAEGVDVLGAVAAGAALLAQGLHRSARGRATPRVNETLGVTLGLITRGGATQRILERGTPLPAQKTLGFPLAAGDRLSLVVVQGSASEMTDNAVLGAFDVVADRSGEALLHVAVGADGRVDLTAQPPGSRSLVPQVRGTSLDRETLLQLLPLAPQPADREPDPRPGRLWGSIRRLLGGR